MAEAIQVLVRVRPRLAAERDDHDPKTKEIVAVDEDSNEVVVGAHRCVVDRVFGAESSQEQLFESLQAGIASTLSGFNATVLAYGQTGSGKTHTMLGHEIEASLLHDAETIGPPANWGVIPRAMDYLFQAIAEYASEGVSCVVSCSYIQIYNDRLFDLLGDASRARPLAIREQVRNGQPSVFVSGLAQVQVGGADEVLRLIRRGGRNRAVRATEYNEVSSRSHAILQVNIESESRQGEGATIIRRAKLNLVDLAGSEKWDVNRSLSDDRTRELAHINKSLSALGNCIAALADRRRAHIPYRDSKLTRLLQDSLGGNTRTTVIATLAPTAACEEDSLSTLIFADRARQVLARVTPNEVVDDAVLLARANREIARLRDRVGERQQLANRIQLLERRLRAVEEENRFLTSLLEAAEPELRQRFLDWRRRIRAASKPRSPPLDRAAPHPRRDLANGDDEHTPNSASAPGPAATHATTAAKKDPREGRAEVQPEDSIRNEDDVEGLRRRSTPLRAPSLTRDPAREAAFRPSFSSPALARAQGTLTHTGERRRLGERSTVTPIRVRADIEAGASSDDGDDGDRPIPGRRRGGDGRARATRGPTQSQRSASEGRRKAQSAEAGGGAGDGTLDRGGDGRGREEEGARGGGGEEQGEEYEDDLYDEDDDGDDSRDEGRGDKDDGDEGGGERSRPYVGGSAHSEVGGRGGVHAAVPRVAARKSSPSDATTPAASKPSSPDALRRDPSTLSRSPSRDSRLSDRNEFNPSREAAHYARLTQLVDPGEESEGARAIQALADALHSSSRQSQPPRKPSPSKQKPSTEAKSPDAAYYDDNEFEDDGGGGGNDDDEEGEEGEDREGGRDDTVRGRRPHAAGGRAGPGRDGGAGARSEDEDAFHDDEASEAANDAEDEERGGAKPRSSALSPAMRVPPGSATRAGPGSHRRAVLPPSHAREARSGLGSERVASLAAHAEAVVQRDLKQLLSSVESIASERSRLEKMLARLHHSADAQRDMRAHQDHVARERFHAERRAGSDVPSRGREGYDPSASLPNVPSFADRIRREVAVSRDGPRTLEGAGDDLSSPPRRREKGGHLRRLDVGSRAGRAGEVEDPGSPAETEAADFTPPYSPLAVRGDGEPWDLDAWGSGDDGDPLSASPTRTTTTKKKKKKMKSKKKAMKPGSVPTSKTMPRSTSKERIHGSETRVPMRPSERALQRNVEAEGEDGDAPDGVRGSALPSIIPSQLQPAKRSAFVMIERGSSLEREQRARDEGAVHDEDEDENENEGDDDDDDDDDDDEEEEEEIGADHGRAVGAQGARLERAGRQRSAVEEDEEDQASVDGFVREARRALVESRTRSPSEALGTAPGAGGARAALLWTDRPSTTGHADAMAAALAADGEEEREWNRRVEEHEDLLYATGRARRGGKKPTRPKRGPQPPKFRHDARDVGCRVSVHIARYDIEMEGTITAFDAVRRLHLVVYDDGSRKWHDMRDKKFSVLAYVPTQAESKPLRNEGPQGRGGADLDAAQERGRPATDGSRPVSRARTPSAAARGRSPVSPAEALLAAGDEDATRSFRRVAPWFLAAERTLAPGAPLATGAPRSRKGARRGGVDGKAPKVGWG